MLVPDLLAHASRVPLARPVGHRVARGRPRHHAPLLVTEHLADEHADADDDPDVAEPEPQPVVAAPDDPTHAADHTDHAADDADHPAHVSHHVAHVSERPLDEPPAATAEPDAVRDWHGDAACRVAHTGLRPHPHLRHHAAAHTGPRPVDEPDGCAVGRPERRPALSR